MDLRSGRKDLIVPSIIHMTLAHETLFFCGKPLGRPPDQTLVRYVSNYDAPFIDPGGMEALGGHDTTLRVLGRLKEEGDILPTSSLPTLISNYALWKGKHGKDSSLPTYTFYMGYFKEKGSHMIDFICDISSALSLWRIDPYWKSQLLVDYSKDIFTCLILDDLHEEGY